ncbi:GTP-binding protein 1-like [Notamacropus eugenii]|uniref:GTP-binding protein 1-like n=1 Tax=Notamacropus eugenii TaxID=9315 RepID=UPI003B66F0A0
MAQVGSQPERLLAEGRRPGQARLDADIVGGGGGCIFDSAHTCPPTFTSSRRVTVGGNVTWTEKSTLLSVLTRGELDNGRGFSRQKLFWHKQEIESGRSSGLGNDILGFDSDGNVVNKPDTSEGS